MTIPIYTSGRPLMITGQLSGRSVNGMTELVTLFNIDGTDVQLSEIRSSGTSVGYDQGNINIWMQAPMSAGEHTVKMRYRVSAGETLTAKARRLLVFEE